MILGADIKEGGKWLNSYTDQGVRYITRAGRLWGSILTRTKKAGSFNTYHSTTEQAENGFANFQEFAEWANGQPSYWKRDKEGKLFELDKDILGKGSKVYSKDTCAFVPQHINKLLNEQKTSVGDLPLGVSFHAATGKYSAKLSSYNRRIWLGAWDTPEVASRQYKVAKYNEIIRMLTVYTVDELGETVYLALCDRARKYNP